MNCIFFSIVLLYAIIGQVYGRVVNFSLLTFGQTVTVTFGEKTLNMKPIDDYSHVHSISGICPDDIFEYAFFSFFLFFFFFFFFLLIH